MPRFSYVKLDQPIGEQIGVDEAAIFAHLAGANTQKSFTYERPEEQPAKISVIVHNPSTVTDITVKVFAIEADIGGGVQDGLIASFTVPKTATVTGTEIECHVKQVYGAFNGTDMKLILSNDTVLGADEGFTATVRVRELA